MQGRGVSDAATAEWEEERKPRRLGRAEREGTVDLAVVVAVHCIVVCKAVFFGCPFPTSGFDDQVSVIMLGSMWKVCDQRVHTV